MKIAINYFYTFIFFQALFLTIGCSKQNKWLDVKPRNTDVVPTTTKDFMAILDYDVVMNRQTPALGMFGIDNFYISSTQWQGLLPYQRNAYNWSSEIYTTDPDANWSDCYQMVAYANVALDGISKIEVTQNNQSEIGVVKGEALFYRSFAFYHLLSLYTKPYSASTAVADLGIPLHLKSDVNDLPQRSNLFDCYAQVIKDLKEAELLLPVSVQLQTRPSKVAVQSLIARIYLIMANYSAAGEYSNKALQNYNFLYDYNDASLPATNPFPKYPNNKEVIFYSIPRAYTLNSTSFFIIDSTLFNSYQDNDLRKTKYYRLSNGQRRFHGSYAGTTGLFSGLATNELYFIRAECYARNSDVTSALNDLNFIMQKRWKSTVPFVQISASTPQEALTKILIERRKEFPFTGNLRWDDLKRLNSDANFATTLTRVLNSQTYSLSPNDNKYIYAIPKEEIRISGIQQNPR